ncbi:integrase [Polynucleobacter aenigmaticus]|uniref:Integrase n=1 Tax=Polynucleobacter aenigmaticus TaxID=1743164 RepID=A0A254PXX5_9BURK|nr:tyrosine-type recombinase/integrase [Polynucleobacter aenigmaticus]OWS69411.1 integrase [Polynucleobacter aenigmaticus]
MASIRFRSNKWQARVSRKGEQSLVSTFQSKEDAERWARSIEVEWDRGTYTNTHQAQKTNFGELIERYLREVTPTMRGVKEDTIRLKAILRKPIAKVNTLLLNSSRIAQYRDERLKEVSAGTVIRELAYFSSIINQARREWGINIANPVLLVRKPPSPQGRNRILTYEEEQKLLHACEPKANRNIYTRPFVILALETAMRRGELLGLKWANIDIHKRTAFILLTKNGESRTVPLSTRAIETLQGLPRSIDGRVLPINFAALETNFKRARDRAELLDLRIHDLRHTAVTRLAGKLPNLIELSAVTGHKSLSMLKRYYHPNPEQLAKKIA